MGLILVGVICQLTIQRKWVMTSAAGGGKAKLAAVLSIVVWTLVGAAGKGIPYV
jgi:hypothetical protein